MLNTAIHLTYKIINKLPGCYFEHTFNEPSKPVSTIVYTVKSSAIPLTSNNYVSGFEFGCISGIIVTLIVLILFNITKYWIKSNN